MGAFDRQIVLKYRDKTQKHNTPFYITIVISSCLVVFLPIVLLISEDIILRAFFSLYSYLLQ